VSDGHDAKGEATTMTTGISQSPDDSIPDLAPYDRGRRQQELLEREDDVVQHLTVAKFALAIGDVAAADAAVDAALSNSRRAITDMVDETDASRLAGRLLRSEPAAPVLPPLPPGPRTR
jgi:hypothetical protein